ncbi:MAG TPA: hypothetical protein VGC05_24760 [Mycobacterium sp.]
MIAEDPVSYEFEANVFFRAKYWARVAVAGLFSVRPVLIAFILSVLITAYTSIDSWMKGSATWWLSIVIELVALIAVFVAVFLLARRILDRRGLYPPGATLRTKLCDDRIVFDRGNGTDICELATIQDVTTFLGLVTLHTSAGNYSVPIETLGPGLLRVLKSSHA